MNKRVTSGAVLGSLLFIIDLLCVGDVLREMKVPKHKYADDSH